MAQNKRAKERDDRRMIRRGDMREQLRKVAEVHARRRDGEDGLEEGEGLVRFTLESFVVSLRRHWWTSQST
jgi:hypothetical protein